MDITAVFPNHNLQAQRHQWRWFQQTQLMNSVMWTVLMMKQFP